MGGIAHIPEPVRAAARALLPRAFLDYLRSNALRRYDVSLVVVRETPVRAWVNRHILRLYYPPSMVTREGALRRWYARRVRHELPRLHHFEIHITDHCNLNCKGCGHFSNICPPSVLEVGVFEEQLRLLSTRLQVDQIFLLGGEPLLHPHVDEIARVAREAFPDTRICLMTNGTLVTRMPDEFWRALAKTRTVLICDAYPIGLPVAEIQSRAAAFGVALEWTDARDKFFKIPIDVTGSQDASDSYRRCEGLCNCPMYKDGRLYPCAYSAYIDTFTERFEVDGVEATAEDSIDVAASSGEEIMRFLLQPVPFCRHCDFDHFEMYEWGRSERKIEEWTCGPRS